MKSGHGFHRKGLIIIKPDVQDNMDYVASLNDGQIDDVPMRYEYEDPRKATPQQRALFWKTTLSGSAMFFCGSLLPA